VVVTSPLAGLFTVLLQSVNTSGRPVHESYHPSKAFKAFMQDIEQYLQLVYFIALLLQE
jgi:hypothetical protein